MKTQNESTIQNRRTLLTLNKISHRRNNQTFQPFPQRQHSIKITKPYEFSPYYLSGATWDAKHLNSFILNKQKNEQKKQRVNTANQKQKSKFDNDKKNISKYGYTNVLPFIQKPQLSRTIADFSDIKSVEIPKIEVKQNLLTSRDRLKQNNQKKKAFQQYRASKLQNINKIKMKQILKTKYPHGISGYENPQSSMKFFCQNLDVQKTLSPQKVQKQKIIYKRYIKSPLFKQDSQIQKQTYDLSPDFKRKHHQQNYYKIGIQKAKKNKSSKSQRRQFNIINNTNIQ